MPALLRKAKVTFSGRPLVRKARLSMSMQTVRHNESAPLISS